MEISIRKAEMAEVKDVARVHLEAYNDSYIGLFPEAFLAERTFDYRHGMWVAYLKDDQRHAFVAETNGKLCGLVRYGRPEGVAATSAPHVGEVHQLYVVPDARNAGVGTKLLQHAEDQLLASGFTEALLWVAQGRSQSMAFYERLGWRQGEVKSINFSGVELPLLRMEKQLTSR